MCRVIIIITIIIIFTTITEHWRHIWWRRLGAGAGRTAQDEAETVSDIQLVTMAATTWATTTRPTPPASITSAGPRCPSPSITTTRISKG